MSFDELIFGKVAGYFKKKKKLCAHDADKIILLEDIRPRLTLIASALTGTSVEIYTAEREGGYKGANFFLPASISLFPSKEQNLSFYFFRIMYLAVQRKLNLNWFEKEELSADTAIQKAQNSAPVVLEQLFSEYPATRDLHTDLVSQLGTAVSPAYKNEFSWLYGKWMPDAIEMNGTAQKPYSPGAERTINQAREITVLKAKAAENVKVAETDKKQQEDYVLTHNFEKVETADEFNGGWRDFDGDDDLADHANALDELDLKFTVRADDPAHSVYQADFLENTVAAEMTDAKLAEFAVTYPEWNYIKQEYKEHFCTLYPVSQHEVKPAYYENTIKKNKSTLLGLRKMLTHINNKSQQLRRQVQGDEFETDAVTDLYTEVHSGHTPDDKIYLSTRKREKDMSILLLLDISLSSDSYAAGNKVIDVEKDVSILFGEILNEFNIDFSINCFYSRTRNHSTYLTVKDFEEDWNIAKMKIGAVSPGGYTRIGTAIRHSGVLLNKRPGKNKWLILISDGKPNDFDRYEGKYGVRDVKQALRELNDLHISSYALAIEKQAKYYLPQMFGQNHYQILTTPVELLQSLVKLYEKIRHQS